MHGIIQRSHATSVIRYMYLIFLIDIHMGRFLSLMLAMCALFFEGFAQRQVQGIARPDLNTGKTNFRSGELRSDTRFSFEDIQFWVGSGSNVSDCSTTSCAFDFSVGCTPL